MRALIVTWGVTLLLLALAAAGLAFWPEGGGPDTGRQLETSGQAKPAVEPERQMPHAANASDHDVPADQKNAAGTDAKDGAPPAAHAPTTAEDGAHDVGTGEKAAPATTPPATSLADSKAGALPFALAPAPDPALVEKTSEGLLPIRGADGRVPWQAYSRPFLADPGTPKIALVVIGLGLSEARTRAAIEELPGEVTLAFSPYGRRLQDYAREARAHGHETLVMVPMEPRDYPANDPGPLGLLTKLTPAQNLQRLRRILGRFAGHVGIVNDMGSRFSAEREALSPVIAEIGRRGLLVLDARTTARSKIPELAGRFGVPFARNDRHIDNVARGAEIDRYLAELETLARRRGQAVGIGHPYPITIARIRAFAEGLQTRGLVLAPVSTVVEIPTDEGGEAR